MRIPPCRDCGTPIPLLAKDCPCQRRQLADPKRDGAPPESWTQIAPFLFGLIAAAAIVLITQRGR
jgi:hypothetical protein